MIRRHFLAGSTVALALLVAGAVVYAQGPGPGGRGGRGAGGPARDAGFSARALDLSQTQREQIRELSNQHRDALVAAADRVRAAHEAQRTALNALPVNEGQVRSTTQAMAEAQTELALGQARLRGEVFALLTPEQQAEARKLQEDRQTRVQQRRDRIRERLQERRQPRQRS